MYIIVENENESRLSLPHLSFNKMLHFRIKLCLTTAYCCAKVFFFFKCRSYAWKKTINILLPQVFIIGLGGIDNRDQKCIWPSPRWCRHYCVWCILYGSWPQSWFPLSLILDNANDYDFLKKIEHVDCNFIQWDYHVFRLRMI